MGEVYRAKDTRLGREVAVKVLPQHLSSNAEVRARLSVPLAAGSMEPGAEVPLFRVLLRPGYSTLDMSADGRTFVVNTLASEGAAPIVVLSNWTQELPSR